MDAIDICVPTPLRKTKDPDLSYVVLRGRSGGGDAQARAAHHPRIDDLSGDDRRSRAADARGEGASRPTSTSSWRFRPSASIPGNPQFKTKNIPKIVGGVGPASTEVAAALYGAIVQHVVPVSSTRVAEMVKLLENTFRAVNIGLVNEIALMCHKMDIDVWEVIDAAKTKPFGFMPFYPGPGLGGHCIPIDPFYLSWKARQNGFECRFIELAGQVNGAMPRVRRRSGSPRR